MTKRFILLGVTLSVLFFFAQEAHGLVVGPARFEARLPPGEVAGADYYAQNDSQEVVHVVVKCENRAVPTDIPVEKWLELDTYGFDLKPREIKKLRVTIKTPTDISGELSAIISFTSAVSGTEQISASGIQSRLGCILYVAVKGTETPNLELNNIIVSGNAGEGAGALDVELRVSNRGNVHILPTSAEVLIEEDGRKLAKLEPKMDKSVMPGDSCEYKASWKNPGLKPGKYSAVAVLKYGKMYGIEKEVSMKKMFEVAEKGDISAK